jgi:sialic acid synthase SpsE
MIIAEIGQNHCGNMELARLLIREAKEGGADLAKFQLYDHKVLYGDNPNIPNVELSFDQARMLFDYGKEIGIEVFFSVFDIERVRWCEEIGVKRYKIAHSQKDNTALFGTIWVTGKPFIVSSDIPTIYNTLFCISRYPTELVDLRFGDISFDLFDGFSDHTIGLNAAKIAMARGAKIIEKHLAIDHKTGIDAGWSMIPSELQELKGWEKVVHKVL